MRDRLGAPRLQFAAVEADRWAMVSARFLILDDDEGVRAAGSAREAFYQIALQRPDAILVDLKMPLVNGVGFLYRLRADPANQDIPVGLITGAIDVDDATADDLTALRAQVWHKPLSIEDIHDIARTLLAPTPPAQARPIRHI